MYATSHQTFAFAMKFQWAPEGLWLWFNDGWITLKTCEYFVKSRLDKIIKLSLLKAFSDNKLNVTQTITFVIVKVEIIKGKGENAGYQTDFLLFPHCFQETLFLRAGIVYLTYRIYTIPAQGHQNS